MLVKIVPYQWNKCGFETSILVKSAFFALISLVMVACSAPRELSEAEESVLIQRLASAGGAWRGTTTPVRTSTYLSLPEGLTPEMYRNRYFSGLDRVLTGVKVVAYDRDAAVASVRVGVMSRPLKDTSSASRAVAVTPANLSEAWLWNGGNGGTTKTRKTGGVNSWLQLV